MVCGLLLILEGVLNAGCTIYTAMMLHDLDKAAEAALSAGDTAGEDQAPAEEEPVHSAESQN